MSTTSDVLPAPQQHIFYYILYTCCVHYYIDPIYLIIDRCADDKIDSSRVFSFIQTTPATPAV